MLAPAIGTGIPVGMSFLEGLSFSQIAGPDPERRVLPNGLEVIYVHRPNIGLCTAQAWVRTGSAHEGHWEGSGISHYLEHMVFKGTGRFTNRELTEAVHRSGGNSNAYTTFDRTVYHIDAPQEGFETAMEALSEMVFDPLIAEADCKMEREVILREIAMRDDEHDSVLAEQVLAETLRSHPMRHPIIGHRELFIGLTPDDLRAYHAGRYTTTNVVLAIGGSMEPEEAFASAERWFGRFSRRPGLEIVPAFEPPQAGPRRCELVRDVSTTKGVATWRVPGFFEEGRAPLDLCLGVLGSGNSSLLWDELREKRKLVHAIDAHVMGIREVGLAWLSWIGDAGTDAAAVERAYFEVIDALLQKGVSQAQLDKVRRQSVVSMVNGLKNIHSAVARYGYAACAGHDISWPRRGVEELAKVTPEALTKSARQWLKPETVTQATMRGQKSAEAALARRPVPTAETFEVLTLANGVRVIFQPDEAIPKAGFGVFVAAGAAYEEAAKRGSTGLLSTLLTRDTAKRSKEEVAGLVDAMGATFVDYGTQITCGVWGEGLCSDFAQVAELVADGVLCPKLLPETFETERAAAIAACREAADDIVEKARLGLMKQFFGEHPLAVDACGTPETLAAIAPADLAALHQRLVVAGNLVVGVSGSYDRQAAMDLIEARFGHLPKVPFETCKLPAHAPRRASRERHEAVGEQAVVCVAYPHCGFGPDLVTAANVAEELLSGMASGLFHRVREEKGLAYFVGATRVETVDQGMFYLYAGTTAEAAEEVIQEMQAELVRLRKGEFKPGEIEDAKRRLRVGRRQGRQSAGARMQGAMVRELVGLGANFDGEWERRMAATDERAVQAFARRYLDAPLAQTLVMVPKKA
jgi:zinc protease